MPTTLEELKSDVDTLKARMDVADSDRMETKQLLKDIKKDIGSLSGNVGSLYHPLMSTATDDIAGILAGIGDLKTDMAAVKTDVADLKGQFARMDERQDRMDERLDRMDGNIADLKQDVGGLKQDVGELKQGMGAIMKHLGVTVPKGSLP